MPRPIDKTLSPAAGSTNNICLAQTTAGAQALLLNGSTAGALDYASVLAFASTGNISGVTFTIVGTDARSVAVTDTVTGINNSTVKTTNLFKTVSSITSDGAVGTNVTVGTTGRDFVSDWSALNFYGIKPYRVELIITGTANVTVQECFDDLSSETPVWYDVAGLDRVSASCVGKGSEQATGVRIRVNSTSSTPTIQYRIIQAHGDED